MMDHKLELDNSIINEFKSNYIELCSQRNFVTKFITSVPNDVELFGFTPDTNQDELRPFGLKYSSGGEYLLEPTYNFEVEYHLVGSFYYYKKSNPNQPIEIRAEFNLKYVGCIMENGTIYNDKLVKLS